MTLKILSAHYSPSIEALELPAFRGAVIHTLGKENQLFHNHQDDKSVSYLYPKIQYKRIAKSPALICINIPQEYTQLLFVHPTIPLVLKAQTLHLSLQQLKLTEHQLAIGKVESYSLTSWIALNSENYQKYLAMSDELSKTAFLEAILKGNIISFAKGVGWEIEQTIQLRIDDIQRVKLVPFKGQRLTAFDITFRTNVSLPEYIGLGKGVSLGFGMVLQLT